MHFEELIARYFGVGLGAHDASASLGALRQRPPLQLDWLMAAKLMRSAARPFSQRMSTAAWFACLVASGCNASLGGATSSLHDGGATDMSIALTDSGEGVPDMGSSADAYRDAPADAPAAEASVDASAADAGSSGSLGCGTPHASGLSTITTTVRGETRTYLVSVPAGYDADVPVPLVIGFHGCGGSSAGLRNFLAGIEGASVENAFGARGVFVYPQALAAGGCATGWEMSNTGRDVEFVDVIESELQATHCIDTRGIVAYGHSYGGDFTHQLACARPERVVVGAPSEAYPANGTCGGPVAMWINHAEGDPLTTIEQGIDARDRWLDENGCSATENDPQSPSPPCVRYRGCSAHPVVTCFSEGGDHFTFEPAHGANVNAFYLEQIGSL
ncbi:MAG: hypothetical protein IPK60_11590 [Sandaracinaceae bacterium]|nr:hypothetical protein [Sandaracinaceae bacterium]